MWCLEALPRLEAASRRNFHCLGLGLGLGLDPSCLGLGLGLDLAASVLLLPRGTNHREGNVSPTTYYVN